MDGNLAELRSGDGQPKSPIMNSTAGALIDQGNPIPYTRCTYTLDPIRTTKPGAKLVGNNDYKL